MFLLMNEHRYGCGSLAGAGRIGIASAVADNDDQQSHEQEDDRKAERQPADDFFASAFFGFGKDIQTTTGDSARGTFRFTTLKQTQNNEDERDDDENDVIPLKHCSLPTHL